MAAAMTTAVSAVTTAMSTMTATGCVNRWVSATGSIDRMVTTMTGSVDRWMTCGI